mmetsp:Transcript_10141/g.1507  ORF Transcript_10141/g.1507 Transcript_10141/m.1507 type:complete len:102 (+) Transcript_10141:1749-2054(+)
MRDNRDCDRDWFYEDTVFSWYESFNAWVGQGLCIDSTSGSAYNLTPEGLIPATFFNICLTQWQEQTISSHFRSDLYFSNGQLNTARIKGRVQYINDKEDQL